MGKTAQTRRTGRSGKKVKTTKLQTKRRHFNDLLLPVIFTLCVLPFTIRLKEYDYGYSEYAWHSEESVMQDLYTWYRMVFFLAIAAMALIVLLFRMTLYKERNRSAKIFLPFGLYLALAGVSCVFSMNQSAAWLGNFVDLEGFFVLAGYGVIAFYTYQIMEEEHDYAAVWKGMGISFIIMSAFGWMQVFGKDALGFPFVQRLIMSEEYYEYYEGEMYSIFSGNNVSLSLYNPNYAVIYLIMFAAVFAVFLMFSQEKKQRIVSGILLLDALILSWFTYSRAGLAAFAVVMVLGAAVLLRKYADRAAKYVIGILCGTAVLLVGLATVDLLAFGGRYMNRLIDEKKDNNLKAILTTSEGVEINYGEDSYLLHIEGEGEDTQLHIRGTDGTDLAELSNAADSYILPIGEGCEINFLTMDGESTIWVELFDNLFTFVKRDGEYIYETSWGKEDRMIEIAHADAGGLEYLGSGRVYIWTRILPLLQKYIFVGSGPDTFAEVFPQNDYTGKLVYAETPARIIERAHNDYLMKWVQTGFLSVLSLLAFYVLILNKGFAFFRDGKWNCSAKNLLALGCLLGCAAYMVCGIFSDSTLYTSPTFYVFAGIVLSVVCDAEKRSGQKGLKIHNETNIMK